MLKRVLISAAIALVITLTGLYINYRYFLEHQHLRWSLKHHGGEITIENGFGLRAVHVYGMTPDQAASHKLVFDALNFLVFLLAVTAVIFLILWLGGMIGKAGKRS